MRPVLLSVGVVASGAPKGVQLADADAQIAFEVLFRARAPRTEAARRAGAGGGGPKV